MIPTLDGVDLKLRRCDEHLAFLNDSRNVFLRDHDEVTLDFEPETGDYVLRYVGDQPPSEWAISVSEFAHLARSALDNFLWQLILLRKGTPNKRTQFPIYDSDPEKPRQAGRCERKPQPWQGIKGVRSPDAAFIKGAQPYKLGREGKVDLSRWHPLAMLGHLNNIDKHQTIHLAVVAGGAIASPFPGVVVPLFYSDFDRLSLLTSGKLGVTIPVGGVPTFLPFGRSLHVMGMGLDLFSEGRPVDVDTRWQRATDDDPAEIIRFLGVGRPYPEVSVQPIPALDISFSNVKRPVSIYDLYEIRREVGRIVDNFRADFV